MARSSEYTYNPQTGEWTKSSGSSSGGGDSNNNTKPSSSNTTSGGNTGSENLTSSNPNKDSSTGAVEKQYNTIEIKTLEGTLSFIATEETIKLKAGDTVKLKGLGRYLSGNYYVKDITRQISSNGYEHSATLIKTDFGDSLKVSSDKLPPLEIDSDVVSSSNTGGIVTKKKVSSTVSASTSKRTYTVQKGDSLYKIAKEFYGDGSLYSRIYEANKSSIANKSVIRIGQVLNIP